MKGSKILSLGPLYIHVLVCSIEPNLQYPTTIPTIPQVPAHTHTKQNESHDEEHSLITIIWFSVVSSTCLFIIIHAKSGVLAHGN